MKVLADDSVAIWAGEQLGVTFQQPYTAFGFVRNNEIKGAVVFNDYYRGGNVGITYVGSRSFGKQQISFMCAFAFNELKASRVTARTRRANKVMRSMLPRFGFQYESTQKKFYGPEKGDDALVFVMYPEDAQRWLRRI